MNIQLIGHHDQGVKTAATILAKAALLSGVNSQEITYHDSETVNSYVRLEKTPVQEKGQFEKTDILLVFEASLLPKDMKELPILIINAEKKPAVKNKKTKVHALDATKLATDLTGKPIPNTIMLGALIKYFNKISAKNLKTVIDQEIPIKQAENKQAIDIGFKAVK